MIGAGGRTLKYITNEAEETLREMFGHPFKLVLCAHIRTPRHHELGDDGGLESLLGYRLTPERTMADLTLRPLQRPKE